MKLQTKKKLKALDIITKKKVNVWCVSRVSLEDYNTKFVNQDWRILTQEEYDLLREVIL